MRGGIPEELVLTGTLGQAFADSDLDFDLWSAIIDSTMAQLVVRQLDDELVLALKQRAARSGRSAEAEHREILREALRSELQRPSFKHFLLDMPAVGEDEDFASPRDLPREPAL